MDWTQIGQDINGEVAGDQSGFSVGISTDGSRVAIGATLNDGNGNNSGHVRVWEWNGTSWIQIGQDIDGEAVDDLGGYSVDISGDGSRIAIGAFANDNNGITSGHVRIWEYNGTSWIQIGQDIDGEDVGDSSGYSLSISDNGSRVAIGARFNDGNGSLAGHARVWEYNGTSWIQIGQDIDGESSSDQSGVVSISGDGSRVAIGARLNDGNGTSSGHVRIWEYNGTNWVQIGQDIDGENGPGPGPKYPAGEDESGEAVSLSNDGSRVAIGARFNNGNGLETGHVRVWEFNGTSWVQIGQDIDGEADSDESGYSVSISSDGSRVAISSIENDGNGGGSGHARVWEFNGTSWIQIGQDIDGEVVNDQSGHSISISGDGTRVAVGAIGNDGNGGESGHVRIWDGFAAAQPEPEPEMVPPTVQCQDVTVNLDANGQVTIDYTDVVQTVTGGTEPFVYMVSQTLFDCTDLGDVTVDVVVTDDTAQTSECMATVTVVDPIPPEVTAPMAITVECGDSTDPTNTGTATATDNCTVSSLTFSDATVSGMCPVVYTITRTWLATDSSGNTATADQTIEIQDTVGPVAPSPPVDTTIECLDLVPTNVTLTATDACDGLISIGGVDTTVDNNDCTFTVLRTWTFTDNCGNVSGVTQNIQVIDTTPPEITAPFSVTVECGESTDPTDTGTATATDNCTSTPTVTFSDATVTGTCPAVYIINRTWIATDDCGNSASTVQSIEVQDTLAPTAPSAPADVTFECVSQIPTADSLTATDACEGDISATGIDNILNPGNCPLFIQRTWTFTDTCNNSSGATQNITVIDTTPPVLGTPPPDQTFTFNQACPPTQLAWTDNCDGTGLVSSDDTLQQILPGDIQIFERTWTYIDLCGNSVQAGPQILTKFPKPRESFNFGSGRTYVYC